MISKFHYIFIFCFYIVYNFFVIRSQLVIFSQLFSFKMSINVFFSIRIFLLAFGAFLMKSILYFRLLEQVNEMLQSLLCMVHIKVYVEVLPHRMNHVK